MFQFSCRFAFLHHFKVFLRHSIDDIILLTVKLPVNYIGDGVDVDTCSSSSLATAAVSSNSGQLFMVNLLVHSLMDDDAGLKVVLESALNHEVQVILQLITPLYHP